MWVRERDVIDYGVVSAVSLLLYLHLPFRPAIRDRLRWVADAVTGWIEESPEAVAAVVVVVVALGGAAFVLGVVRHASH